MSKSTGHKVIANSVSPRVAGVSRPPLVMIHDAVAAVVRAQVERDEAVVGALEVGISYARVAAALGVSRQAVRKRFGEQLEPLREQLERSPEAVPAPVVHKQAPANRPAVRVHLPKGS